MPQALRARALRLLARREYSRAELASRLAPHAESPAAIEALLDDLERGRQLSDERYAELRARVLARKYGAARIRLELTGKGIDEAAAGRLAAGTDDLQRAREILRRKYRTQPDNPAARARRARFLQGRGFSFDVIRRALGEAEED